MARALVLDVTSCQACWETHRGGLQGAKNGISHSTKVATGLCCPIKEADLAFVSVTRLRVRSIFYLPQFIVYALRSSRQAQKTAGFVDGRLMRDARNAFWTLTVWTDAKAMDAYRTAGAHRMAMPKLINWCDEASLVHWTQESSELPSWNEAHERMVKEGRLSKVNHPSLAQIARDIPPPKPSRFANEIRPIQRSA